MRGAVDRLTLELTVRGLKSDRGRGHHRCPVFDTFPVTRGLVPHRGRRETVADAPISRANRRQERVMNTKHRPGEQADSNEDDTEGRS